MMAVKEQQEKDAMGRRDFLKIAWGVAGGLALVEVGAMTLSFLAPRSAEGEFGGVFNVGAVDEFPPGTVTPFNEGRFYLVRLTDGGFLALYRKCTHLGCAVPWNQAENRFVCPCHASAFEADGDVINPPAPRPLDRFAVSITDGQIQVDTSTPIERDHPSPDDLVYA
jgi:cytochrome b6-f complex iron-sulfur subunit